MAPSSTAKMLAGGRLSSIALHAWLRKSRECVPRVTDRTISCCAAALQEAPVAPPPQEATAQADAAAHGSIALLDASAFIHRFHHGYSASSTKGSRPRLTSPADSHDTSIQHAFLNFVFTLALRDNAPCGPLDHIVVVFDSAASPGAALDDAAAKTSPKSYRRQLLPEYKGKRAETPESVRRCMQDLPGVLHDMGFNSLAVDGWEADDVIATLTRHFANRGACTTIFSRDKDFQQLLQSDQVALVREDGPRAAAHFNDTFQEKHGFAPHLFPEFQALAGDASDGVPGVKGIGDKRAAKLVKQWGTLENMFTMIHAVKSEERKKLEACGLQQAIVMRELVRLHTDVRTEDGTSAADLLKYPVSARMHPSAGGAQNAREYLQQHGMNTALRRFDEALKLFGGPLL